MTLCVPGYSFPVLYKRHHLAVEIGPLALESLKIRNDTCREYSAFDPHNDADVFLKLEAQRLKTNA